ncbi:MAG: hypothetical protein NC048_05790 [Bacteroides sp.]|nr:hypothetical protein [Ruminococcus flavefaciens]MCM1554988.1 hypothetical protein [Bacteroides sp.]
MKKIILAMLILCVSVIHAQEGGRISLATVVGTGFGLNKPSYTPFIVQIVGDYNVNKHFSVGVGTGVSLYEKPLIPVFADAKVNVCKPRKFTPFIRCCAGYGLAVSNDACGGMYINPAVGISCVVPKRMKLLVQAGYEMQKLKRLKGYGNDIISTEFVERLNHNIISLKVGIEFR